MPLADTLRRLARSILGNGPATAVRAPGRVTGRPTSSNGASSMHLRWQFAAGTKQRFSEVSVVIRIVEPPTVPALYFWALQASFGANGRTVGAAHMGLQHHPRHPGGGAVNWGGYVHGVGEHGGGELDGSASSLPSALGNVNTRDYPWRAGATYRYRIARSPDRGWRASITDLERDETVAIRDLWAPVDTDELSDIVVWSEVFADCDAPSVTVAWSDPQATTVDGTVVRPVALVTNYQRHADGGCTNTTAAVTGDGIHQITNTGRTTPTQATLALKHSS